MQKTILAVDDKEALRKIMRESFEASGYVVKTAENGVDALSKLNDGLVPDMIITDSEMPEMDGSYLSIKVKEIMPNVIIIMVTGNIGSISPNNSVDLIIQKPNFNILFKTVKALLPL